MQVIKAGDLELMRTVRMPLEQVDGDALRTRPITGVPSAEASVASEGLEGIVVRFAAGKKTKWHHHPTGQVLFVLRGAGRIGTATEIRHIHAGDIAVAAANECHWHGASVDEELVHLAVSRERAVWSTRAVTAEEYAGEVAAVSTAPGKLCPEAAPVGTPRLGRVDRVVGHSLSESRSAKTASAGLGKAIAKVEGAATDRRS
jgi:quercetin dioxygenase-like cupin family protein